MPRLSGRRADALLLADLPHTDIRPHPLRPSHDQAHADITAERVPHHDDLLTGELLPQLRDDRLGVGHHPLDRNGRRQRCGIGGRVILADAALLPLHDREVVLPRPLIRPRGTHHRRPRATVNEQ